jgi:hypothetical protein
VVGSGFTSFGINPAAAQVEVMQAWRRLAQTTKIQTPPATSSHLITTIF